MPTDKSRDIDIEPDEIVARAACSMVQSLQDQIDSRNEMAREAMKRQRQNLSMQHMFGTIGLLKQAFPEYLGTVEQPGTLEATYTTVPTPKEDDSSKEALYQLKLIIAFLLGIIVCGLIGGFMMWRSSGDEPAHSNAYSSEIEEARRAGENMKGKFNNP
ncbi:MULTISPECIES: hypothetical protein [Cyanophyceae]|uniref:hypothetical protein n=1 Tax=Cyanophyceae TaxID=3028117 RepID=UPI00168828D3|nr:hypothetical protein [Trichocoleus sp. FACHB-40]MBD2006349.1 hypothetical protein [Trichocoleus sp. FACHB-40]